VETVTRNGAPRPSFAGSGSRRGLARLFGSLALGTALPRVASADAKKGKKRSTRKKRSKQSEACPALRACSELCCPSGFECCRGQCFGLCGFAGIRDPDTCECRDCIFPRGVCRTGFECCSGVCGPLSASGETAICRDADCLPAGGNCAVDPTSGDDRRCCTELCEPGAEAGAWVCVPA
jgi:hypothetical protein